MCAQTGEKAPSLIRSVFTNKCPRCRKGKLFLDPNPYHLKRTTNMPDHCPVCGQKYELQTGFYFGTGYVSYGISVGMIGTIFAAWALTIGLSFRDNSVISCLILAIVILLAFQPVIQRLSRSIWIAFFVRYDKDWRIHKGPGQLLT